MPKWPLTLAIIAFPVMAAAADAAKTHEVMGTFVSADAKANMFTMKLDDGTTTTGKAEGHALKALKGLKQGDKITVTCKDNEAGEHVAATEIKVQK